MNKEELLKEFNEKVEQLRDEFISKLEDDKKEFELSYPKNEEMLYYFEVFEGEIYDTYYSDNSKVDKYIFEHGLYFNSKEEAEQYIKERKLLFKLQQWAKEKNDGWEPDWSNGDEIKCYIYYLRTEGLLKIGNVYSVQDFVKLPYFKSMPIAKECINLFEDEIIEVLVNGKEISETNNFKNCS
nr:MAG TPA: hypothetical protein [Caudoviricetes sp.]